MGTGWALGRRQLVVPLGWERASRGGEGEGEDGLVEEAGTKAVPAAHAGTTRCPPAPSRPPSSEGLAPGSAGRPCVRTHTGLESERGGRRKGRARRGWGCQGEKHPKACKLLLSALPLLLLGGKRKKSRASFGGGCKRDAEF